MKKTNSGIVAILANYNSSEMRKVLDLKITSGYPTITIPSGFKLSVPELNISSFDYQHITIPPDLNSHITGRERPKIWAPAMKNLVTKKGRLSTQFQKIITVIFPPISDFPVFTQRSYNGALIIAFSQLPHWSENTSFVLELFALQTENVSIPNENHYLGDQGAYMPWKYSEVGKIIDEPYKKGDFWIRQFAVTNHEPKKHKTITVHFWDYNNEDNQLHANGL